MPILLTTTSGDGEHLILDPISEDSANTELDLMAGPFAVTAMSFPAPPLETSTVGNIDTEGDLIAARRHQNRTVSLTVEVIAAGQTELDVQVALLESKVAKLAREGGTLQRIRADGSSRVLDVLAADAYEMQFDITYFVGNVAQTQIELVAKPYARGPEEARSPHSETTLPALVFTETAIDGDVPAAARLVINESASQNQAVALWGVQGRFYDPAATAALFYQAETCALGSGVVNAGPAGASGSNVVRDTTLTTLGETILYVGTTTAAQTHVGTYRLFARVYAPSANAGVVSLTATWAAGSSPLSTNGRVTIDYEGEWLLVDLGLVRIPQAKYGTQRWGAFVNASSTVANDTINIDYLALVPADEGSGEAYSLTSATIPSGGLLQISTDSALKASSSSVYGIPDVYQGDYLRVPCGQTIRFIVIIGRGPVPVPLRADPPLYGQDAIDDVSVTLHVTPRYLTVN